MDSCLRFGVALFTDDVQTREGRERENENKHHHTRRERTRKRACHSSTFGLIIMVFIDVFQILVFTMFVFMAQLEMRAERVLLSTPSSKLGVLTSCMNKHDTFISSCAAPGRPCSGANEPMNDCGSVISNICVCSLEREKKTVEQRRTV